MQVDIDYIISHQSTFYCLILLFVCSVPHIPYCVLYCEFVFLVFFVLFSSFIFYLTERLKLNCIPTVQFLLLTTILHPFRYIMQFDTMVTNILYYSLLLLYGALLAAGTFSQQYIPKNKPYILVLCRVENTKERRN